MALFLIPNIVRQIAVIVQILCWLICLPLMIYYRAKFKAVSSSVMVQKRYPRILKLQGDIIILWFVFGNALLSLDFAELDDFQGETQIIISRINCIVYPIFTLAVFTLMAWRFWHIYFDLKYSSSQKNSEWKYHLDPTLV
eukprot:396869_1